MSLTPLQLDIARFLAIQAIGRQRTTYPELARAVSWNHPQGRGLGSHLWAPDIRSQVFVKACKTPVKLLKIPLR